jgi:hypothetical protein
MLCVLAAIGGGGVRGEPLSVVGTEFRLRLPDGRVLRSAEMVGVVLGVEEGGTLRRVRIDAVRPDPDDASRELLLHDLAVFDDSVSRWVPYCLPDAAGARHGFPYVVDTATGRFTLTCAAGAEAKCIRMGYRPWKSARDGQPLRDYFRACIHLARADYCGDDRPATRDGTLVDVYDRIGIQQPSDDASLHFEAGWGTAGAVCVARTRVPALLSKDALLRRCPRLAGASSGPDCTEERLENDPRALLFNRSRPTAQ